jgi:hypothetical protein
MFFGVIDKKQSIKTLTVSFIFCIFIVKSLYVFMLKYKTDTTM